jgi:hypothetical protein
VVIPEGKSMQEKWCAAVQKTFPLPDIDAQLRRQPAQFETIRNNYPLRNDFSAYTVIHDDPAADTLRQLGFNSIKN